MFLLIAFKLLYIDNRKLFLIKTVFQNFWIVTVKQRVSKTKSDIQQLRKVVESLQI